MFLAATLHSTLASTFGSTTTSATGASALTSTGGVVVDADLTVLWSIGLFLVLIFVLRPVLFEPMLKLFEERERRIDGAKLAARKMDEASAKALATYESEMKKARSAGTAERESQRAEGLKAESAIVDKVRETTAATMSVGRKALADEAATARAALQAETGALAVAFASRVLGREVRG